MVKKLEVLIIMGFSILLILTSCGSLHKNEDNNDELMNDYFEGFVSEYDVIETSDNGSVHISLEAPDLCKICESIYAETGNQDITVSAIADEVKNHPDYQKIYDFWVNSEDDTEIREALLNQVSEELIKASIQNIKYSEEWSAEE